MTNHKNAIKNIKAALKDLAEKKRETKRQLLALKYDTEGKKRPETGPERDHIWSRYQWPTREEARALHLARGFLQGKTYLEMEPSPRSSAPNPHFIAKAIEWALGDDEETKAHWTRASIRVLLIRPRPALAA